MPGRQRRGAPKPSGSRRSPGSAAGRVRRFGPAAATIAFEPWLSGDEMEESLGATMVHVMWLELLSQIDLARKQQFPGSPKNRRNEG